MPECPRCHQKVDSQAIACPYCRNPLKAHGHPGIPLYQAVGDEFLCTTCIYHHDDSCTYPQRPYARECTLYTTPETLQDKAEVYQLSLGDSIRLWAKRNSTLLLFLGLIIISVAIALRAL